MGNAEVRGPANVAASNQVALLIEAGLRERGFTVSRESEGERVREIGPCINIGGISGMLMSSLLVTDDIMVRWEYCPVDGGKLDPKRAADMVTALLADGAAPYDRLGGGYGTKMISYKGIIGRELKARGFCVELKVYQDETNFDAWADISVRRGESGMCAVVDDSGSITWDADYSAMYAAAGSAPDLTASPAGIEEIARDVVARIGRAAGV